MTACKIKIKSVISLKVGSPVLLLLIPRRCTLLLTFYQDNVRHAVTSRLFKIIELNFNYVVLIIRAGVVFFQKKKILKKIKHMDSLYIHKLSI